MSHANGLGSISAQKFVFFVLHFVVIVEGLANFDEKTTTDRAAKNDDISSLLKFKTKN